MDEVKLSVDIQRKGKESRVKRERGESIERRIRTKPTSNLDVQNEKDVREELEAIDVSREGLCNFTP